MFERILENIAAVKEHIARACERSLREPGEVTLITVTKGISLEEIAIARSAGLTAFGENRIQEAESKIRLTGPGVGWHFIGHLQTNKAAKAAELGFKLIQSIDSLRLAQALDKKFQNRNAAQEVLLEINIAQEPQKSGFRPKETLEAFEAIRKLNGLKVVGMMCMGLEMDNPEKQRPYFKEARKLWSQARALDSNIQVLSMGMSLDFEVAIEEKSTMVRVGRAIFGGSRRAAA